MIDKPEKSSKQKWNRDQICALTLLTIDEVKRCITAGLIEPKRGQYEADESIRGAFKWYRKQIDSEPMVTVDEFRNITGLTDQRHRQMANEGHFPAPVRGLYKLKSAVAGVIRYYREHHDKQTKVLTNKREGKLDRENALLDIALGKAAGQLVSVDEMVSRLNLATSSMRQRILSSSLQDDERDALIDDLGHLLDNAIRRPLPPGSGADSSDVEQAAALNGESVGG